MNKSQLRLQYERDYRRARVEFRTYGSFGRDASISGAARDSLYAVKGSLRPLDRLLEFGEMYRDPMGKPFLQSDLFKPFYPPVNRFPTPVIVKVEPEPLSLTGVIYRAFERLPGGALFPLYLSGETLAALRVRVNMHIGHKHPALILA
jgi:hypothetical protein